MLESAIRRMHIAANLTPLHTTGRRLESWTEFQRIQQGKSYYRLGELYSDAGDIGRAITALQQSAKAYPAGKASPWMYFLSGRLLYQEERYEEAADVFQESLLLKPDLSDSIEYRRRIDSLIDSGRSSKRGMVVH